MLSLFKIKPTLIMNANLHLLNRPLSIPNICDSCLRRQHNTNKFYKSLPIWNRSYSVQYKSVLKHILSKRSKKNKKKGKKYVEVMKGTEHSMISTTTSVDTLRGHQLTALANGLSQMTHLKYHTDTTRHFDPLVVLPEESIKDVLDNRQSAVFNVPDPPISRLTKPPTISSYPRFVPDIIDIIKNSFKGDNGVTDITLVRNQENFSVKISSPRTETPASTLPSDFNETLVGQRQLRDFRKKLNVGNATVLHDQTECLSLTHDPTEYIGRGGSAFEEIPTEDLPIDVEEAEIKLEESKKPKKKKASFTASLRKSAREAVAKERMSDLERRGRIESLNSNFLSYADVCVNSNMVNDAMLAVKAYRNRIAPKDKEAKLNNIEIYNTIMEGYAKEGNWNKILELVEFAKEDKLLLNNRTYAAMLDCLGRAKNKNNSLISKCLNEIAEKNFNVNEILCGCAVNTTSFNNILEAVRVIRPDFEPAPLQMDLNYDCPLLSRFNEGIKSFKSPAPNNLNTDDIEKYFKRQLYLESQNYVKIKTIEKRHESLENIQIYREKLRKSMEEWEETINAALERDIKVLKAQGKHKSHFFLTIYPYLVALPRRDYVDITMQEIRKLAEGSETYSPSTKRLYRAIGTQVCLRYQVIKKTKNGSLERLESLFTKYLHWYVNPMNSTATNTRQSWQQLLNENYATATMNEGDPIWKSHVLTGIGRFLYNIIIRDVKVDVNILRKGTYKPHYLPAFYTLFRSKGHMSKEEIKPHPTLSKLFRASAPEELVFEPSLIPMSCPPVPWTTITSGGFLVTRAGLIRLPYHAVSQWKALEKTPVIKLYPAFDSLNQLGSIPWSVNEQVLDVILELFNNGGSSKLDVPEPPSACPAADPPTPDMTPKERYQAFRQRLAVRRRRAEMYSLWCDALYKLSLANHYRGEIFWLPHNMDFRGRVYPVAPHLNHLGSDLSRSLLVFAKGEPLGADGFNWLKIHAINLTGTHKKKSVEDRLNYANEIMDKIIDSAEKPLTGNMWWTESEEPWQTLSACMEINKALKSGNPATYVSNYPVHQDGSCNGLQHYAALGRDEAGGESVNLTPAAVPQDVYSCVVAIVERERAKDAANEVKIAQVLDGFVSRKVIKQTVMTTVYGVTRYGARLQIARQLKDLDNFPKEHVWSGSLYLVNKTFESLQEMFTSTKEIQDWFTECAKLIAHVCGENVEWVTPLGLPIVQPYSRAKTSTANTDHIKFIGVQSSCMADAFERPNVMKQKNAFAPNFVHSLDSSHMMLTSLQCEKAGVTFVSVHDCYWTHASTVTAMNKFCREQFVSLHSQPILEDLSNYFVQRFAYDELLLHNDGSIANLAKRSLNKTLRAVPSTGSLDLQRVLQSPYFFS